MLATGVLRMITIDRLLSRFDRHRSVQTSAAGTRDVPAAEQVCQSAGSVSMSTRNKGIPWTALSPTGSSGWSTWVRAQA